MPASYPRPLLWLSLGGFVAVAAIIFLLLRENQSSDGPPPPAPGSDPRLNYAGPYQNVQPDVNYVVGSGSHGYSFLTDRDGYVFQTPISWYSQKQVWDTAPGWESVGGGRAILPGCLFCHANHVEPVPERVNRYQEPFLGKQAAI